MDCFRGPSQQEVGVLPRDISGGRLYSYERGSGGPTFMTAHGIHDTDMSYHRTFLDRKKEFHWPSKYLPRDFPSCSVLAAKFHLPKTGQDMIGSLKGEAGGWLNALAEWQENCGQSSWGVICHSMGSIIFLQMLLDLVRFAGGGNSIYGKLLKSLRFVVFLAPPFGGSSLADWAKVYIGRGWPIPILQHGSKEIGELVEKAQPLLRGQPIMAGDRKLSQGLKSFSAIESVPPLVLPGWRLGLFLVVPAASVQKLETSEPFFPDASNHSDIAKLVMPDGALYKVLKGFVKNSLLGAADADFVERTPLGAADADSKAVQALVISISSSVVYGHASSCTSPDEFLEAVEQSPEKQYCKVDAARSGSIGVVLDFSDSSAVSSDWLQIAADLMSAGCGEANWALTFVEGEKVEVLSSDGRRSTRVGIPEVLLLSDSGGNFVYTAGADNAFFWKRGDGVVVPLKGDGEGVWNLPSGLIGTQFAIVVEVAGVWFPPFCCGFDRYPSDLMLPLDMETVAWLRGENPSCNSDDISEMNNVFDLQLDEAGLKESVASCSTASTGQKGGGKRPLGPLTIKRSSQHALPLLEQGDFTDDSVLRLPSSHLPDLDFSTGDLVDVSELSFLAKEKPGHMSRSRIEQQLDLHSTCTDLDKIEDAKQGGTLVFEDEAEAGDCQFDEDPTCAVLWDHAVKKTWGTFYKDTWRIEPDQLKCRRKADGQLWKLGQGGRGSVYLGLMHGTTDVAIKVVSSPSPRQLKSFVEEIMIWKTCYHPNIISILGANNQAQQILLTMEFMPGGDLYTQMENDVNKRYTWYQRGYSIALDIVRGLDYIHTRDIMLLNLKSPNILLNAAGAKIAGGPGSCNPTIGWPRGYHTGPSLPWCAPEQLYGDLGIFATFATDIFALGVIMWELCTGEPASMQRNYRRVKSPKEAPEAIAQLIWSCMNSKPEHRPSTSEAHNIITSCGHITSSTSEVKKYF